MANVLIITNPGDGHAAAVSWALRELGHSSSSWIPDDLAAAPAAVRFSDEETTVAFTGADAGRFDTVWLRRTSVPRIPEGFEIGERVVAERECEAFTRGVLAALGLTPLWANHPGAQANAGSKGAQLAAARRAGLRIPRTLMTNDAEVARAFLRGARDGAGDELRFAPGTFQERVPKAYELRVLVMGRTCVAARITGQHEVDWGRDRDMRIEPHVLPGDVEARLLSLMDQLDLVTGSIDLIVTPAGEHVFLEVNEQGPFLWLEDLEPRVEVLEPFARFLASGDRGFRLDGAPRLGLGFADFEGANA